MNRAGVDGAQAHPTPLLQIHDLHKSYGGAPALRSATVEIAAGEVHGLIGANGAGKSTLIKVLAGTVQPDGGTILVDGVQVSINNAQRSQALGLGFIHQELNLIPKFSIAQNLGLGQLPPNRIPFIVNKRRLHEQAREVMERVGLSRKLSTSVEDLSVADQWLVCIGRALMRDARFIAMDEPTASLSHTEADRLFALIHSLRKRGIAIAYVSHRLEEVLDLCDRVTTLRDGRTIETRLRSEITRESLVRTITNQQLPPAPNPISPAAPVVQPLSDAGVSTSAVTPVLTVEGVSQGSLVNIGLSIQPGEIVGLAGLVGSGRTRLLRLLFGLAAPTTGTISLSGTPVSFKNPTEAIAAGIALIPEERRRQGLILDKSVAFNLSLGSLQKSSPLSWLPLYDKRRANQSAREISERLQIKCGDVRDRVGTLSGGNQQKVVFGRWLTRPLTLLLLDEPTRGVDVGARAEIHSVVRDIADRGAGVLMVSSEFQELVSCDRVLVMREGTVVAELAGPSITESNMTALCFGEALQ